MYDQLKSDALESGLKIIKIMKGTTCKCFTVHYFSFGDNWHSPTKRVFFENETALFYWIYGPSPANCST